MSIFGYEHHYGQIAVTYLTLEQEFPPGIPQQKY